ncbi:MAG: hypothetical protein IJT83_01915, partial [Victivallales bacterium]|nr:hypothetical protein [Victivallales bacterium]
MGELDQCDSDAKAKGRGSQATRGAGRGGLATPVFPGRGGLATPVFPGRGGLATPVFPGRGGLATPAPQAGAAW